MNRKSYIKKCCKILEKGQFRQLETDRTKTIEGKLKRISRTINIVFNEREYKRLHPTGSKPCEFYGNAKVHNLRKDEDLKILTLKPMVSDVETAA